MSLLLNLKSILKFEKTPFCFFNFEKLICRPAADFGHGVGLNFQALGTGASWLKLLARRVVARKAPWAHAKEPGGDSAQPDPQAAGR